MTHICVSTLTNIGLDNGLSPDRHQAIIWTNAGILLIEPLGTNFSEILIEVLKISFKKMHLKVSSAKWRPFCLGLNVLKFLLQRHLSVVTQLLDSTWYMLYQIRIIYRLLGIFQRAYIVLWWTVTIIPWTTGAPFMWQKSGILLPIYRCG